MFKLSIPYWVFLTPCSSDSGVRASQARSINEQPIGIMQSKEVSIELPPAQFELRIKILFRVFKWQFSIGGKKKISLAEGEHLHLMIADKERWWNILFDIDLVLWLAKLFFELPHPWNIIYEVVSNGFFALWLARVWFIRNRYFQIIEQK